MTSRCDWRQCLERAYDRPIRIGLLVAGCAWALAAVVLALLALLT